MEKLYLHQEVKKPSRYMGGEFNAVYKKLKDGLVKTALVFPDLYEMGMSNLGLKVLYKVINDRKDSFADRFFSPDIDFEKRLLDANEPLRGLDSELPLAEFNIVGFTLQYELSYTNIVKMLKLNKIPLYSRARDERHPLIIGGGPCSFNPEPVAPFFDCIVVGDGEDVINELVKTYRECSEGGASRERLLNSLSKIPGVYVPSLFQVIYNKAGGVTEIVAENDQYRVVKKRTVQDLDSSCYPVDQVVPFTSLIHDRVSVEIDRGCTHGCRFCQAGIIHRPVRERTPEKVLSLLQQTLKNTGYEEISLGSLSSGDNSSIYPLLCQVMGSFSRSRTSVSFPSLRPSTLTPEILKEVSKVRKTGFTIAAEAGSERLRSVINKKISDEEIYKAVAALGASGWSSLKLYFMIGLPTETIEDVEAIAVLCSKIIKQKNGIRKITVSVSSFVPKSQTPFQFFGQKSVEYIEDAQRLLSRALGKRGNVSLKFHDANMSLLEAVFSRGDRRLSRVIEKAVELGCSFDGWTDRFTFEKWEEAFHLCGLDMQWYATREFGENETLPWEHITTGVTKSFLVREYLLAKKEILTEDCRTGQCNECGLPVKLCRARKKQKHDYPPGTEWEGAASEPEGRFRYRIFYKKYKGGEILSHLELSRVFHRAMRRSMLPLRYSSGFHPHPKISFGFALPVGVRSDGEYCDIELTSFKDPKEVIELLGKQMPKGVPVLGAKEVSQKTSPITEETVGAGFSILLKSSHPDSVEEALMSGLKEKVLFFNRQRKGKVTRVNVISFIGALKVLRKMNSSLLIDIEIIKDRDRLLKPAEVMEALLPNLYLNITMSIKKTRTIWSRKMEDGCIPKS
ncbi:MAG: TIGR03960 family B12-binding radical SAM protein [Nitrospinota bacterium]